MMYEKSIRLHVRVGDDIFGRALGEREVLKSQKMSAHDTDDPPPPPKFLSLMVHCISISRYRVIILIFLRKAT